jgi:hypothetical protein
MDLGSCCICGTLENVRQIRCLDGRCPILGRGWGCVACGLEPHGAVAVLCHDCARKYDSGKAKLRYFCTGHPARDGRTAYAWLGGTWKHTLASHGGTDPGDGKDE